MTKNIAAAILKNLPEKTGIYKFYNQDEILIYVGKAKNIKKRVNSYFSKSHTNRKTLRLVNEIHQIEYALTNSEFDAFLLENNLIKENHPKFNIQMKDDKSFPFICILKERFPRIISTRRFNKSKGEYFGPFSSVVAMNNVLELIRKLYTIRTCNYNLSVDNINTRKFKVCLEFHLGNCKGPCENLQSEDDYNLEIKQAKNILNGNINIVKKFFIEEMSKPSDVLLFEKAGEFKKKLALLDKFQSKTIVVSKHVENADVFTILEEDETAYVNYLKINHCAIVASKTINIRKKLDETSGDILSHTILNLREELKSSNTELFTNIPIPSFSDSIRYSIPKRGEKRKLIELSLKNAFQYKRERQKAKLKTRESISEVLLKLKEDLRLPQIPYRIECFDNSNLMGTNPVASMVCFKNAKPLKSEYRKFNIKTVSGIDDYASMREIVLRRYSRMINENKALPNLVIIDGGKGQLSAALDAINDLGIYGKLAVIGIAKRLEEIYFPKDEVPIHINKSSPSLKLIQKIRNEAHRFAIEFHRNKRSKSINTELDKIKGIGKATTNKLLKRFKSVKKIKESSFLDIAKIVGESKADIIFNYLQKKKGPQSL